ncbi:DUF3784 domain-containing protein [Porphyromonadaceae bacterium OttesenSCG-928-L07]|nr:DUF3784 domain-containing protein [Porphyromonadaceae bacterium OttesenSCG-928-L07]MDL2251239.1 DUF3784 domain-containing protein [Odoribacter sp. OttesenSCG-928-J03]
MGIANFLTAIILITFGILVRFFPNLIAGYNTLSKEDKKKVDAKGLSHLISKTFIITGLINLGLNILVGLEILPLALYSFINIILILVIVVILFWKSQGYYLRK